MCSSKNLSPKRGQKNNEESTVCRNKSSKLQSMNQSCRRLKRRRFGSIVVFFVMKNRFSGCWFRLLLFPACSKNFNHGHVKAFSVRFIERSSQQHWSTMELIETPNQAPFKSTDLLSERNLPLVDFGVAECVSEALCYRSVHKKENRADQPLPNSLKTACSRPRRHLLTRLRWRHPRLYPDEFPRRHYDTALQLWRSRSRPNLQLFLNLTEYS